MVWCGVFPVIMKNSSVLTVLIVEDELHELSPLLMKAHAAVR
jgi:hypothetical protein